MKRIFTATALGLALLAASGGDGFAQDLKKGFEAQERGDFATALKEWRPLADQGNSLAQALIGLSYDRGDGVMQDHKEAFKWYRLSADQGLAIAQYSLGNLYFTGRGVIQDDKEAVKWYRLSADQGEPKAHFLLANVYYLGRGVPQDHIFAHMWWNIAASNGYPDAAKFRDMVAKQMTTADISEAQGLARSCVAKSYKGC